MCQYDLEVQFYNYICSFACQWEEILDFNVLYYIPDNPQSTSNPVIHPVIPVSTTVSSNSSQNITSGLTSDENIVKVHKIMNIIVVHLLYHCENSWFI